jgi:outer membrane protein
MRGENKMVGKKWLLVIGIVILGFLGSARAADLKIAYVDARKAVNECNAGKEAKKSIAKELEKIERLNVEKQKELQTMKETLEKQSPMLTQDARATKEKEFQGKLRDYQRWVDDNQKEIQQKTAEINQNVVIALQKIIEKVGTDEGYTLILEKNETIVLFASKAIDITDRVIKAFDAQKK